MLVRDIMRSPAVTIASDTTLGDAYRIMQEKGIRHLPVLEGDRLAGVVTDRDLRLATSALAATPFPPEARVDRAMHREPLTADPEDPVEDAARTMRERKIGCLPVMDRERLVGIITGVDLLDALVRLCGVDKPSGRLEVRLPDRTGELARLIGLVSDRGLDIHSILTYPDQGAFVRTVLRIGSMNAHPQARALRSAGYDVLWPPEKPWPR